MRSEKSVKEKQVILEACVASVEDALMAEQNGAHRIEFCSRLDLDGLTPDLSELLHLLNHLKIPIVVMVRPREGNFIYSESEWHLILKQISQFKKIGVKHIATGILTANHQIDIKRMLILARKAAPMKITFHKAIDHVNDVLLNLGILKNIPQITHVLSSGKAATALEGSEVLNQMINLVGDSMTVIAAGKITAENLNVIKNKVATDQFHGKRIVAGINKS